MAATIMNAWRLITPSRALTTAGRQATSHEQKEQQPRLPTNITPLCPRNVFEYIKIASAGLMRCQFNIA